ncbi:MAG: L,D-transpeptidase family protein [Pseudomonadota bacterium]
MLRIISILLVGLGGVLPASAEVFLLPDDRSDVIGAIVEVPARAEETFVEIARRHGLGYNDLLRANPKVDPWLPGEGTPVRLPTMFILPPGPRSGVVLNLPEYRLYYYPPAGKDGVRRVHTYPISIGRMDWETPLGRTTVIAKAVKPSWYPPASIRKEHADAGDPLPGVVPPGPDNPLGEYAMRLGLPGYLIHGTNRPAGVGMRVTHGCIRMFPEDIEVLFGNLPVGTPVRIINEPVKAGWLNGQLYVEAHVPLAGPEDAQDAPTEAAQDDGETNDDGQAFVEDAIAAATDELVDGDVDLTAMTRAFVAATRERTALANWKRMEWVVSEGLGLPIQVGEERPAETVVRVGR